MFSTISSRARTSYSEFVRAGISQGCKKELYPPETIPLLGNTKFIKQITDQHELRRKPSHTLRISLTDLSEKISQYSKIKLESLKSRSRARSISVIRSLFSFIAVCHAGHTVSSVARFLNLHPSAITKAIRTAKQRLEDQSDNNLNHLLIHIIKSQ